MKRSSLPGSTFFILSGLIALTAIYIRLRFLETPLDRDEGEYAYIGQILLKGLLPYRDAVNLKFPGIFFIYSSVLLLLPDTPAGVHSALLFTNFLTALFLFLAARQLFNNLTAAVAAVSFLVVTLSPSIHGLSANSEHFVMLFVTSALLLIHRKTRTSTNSFLTGVILGLAVLVKQHALFFLLFFAFYIGYSGIKHVSKRQLLRLEIYFLAGVSLPVFVTAFWLFYTKNTDAFLFWTIKYSLAYATETRIDPEIYRIFFRFLISAPAAVFLAAAGAAGILVRWKREREQRFPLLFFAASLLAMSPGLLFRPHYYILLVPAMSLLAGAGINTILKYEVLRRRETAVMFIVLFSVTSPLVFNRHTLFSLSPDELSRQTYGANPFPESLTVAAYLKSHTEQEDKIAVIGSEPQIYFYADRIAATKYIFTYPLMEDHGFAAGMQRELIDETEKAQPVYIVFVSVATSWLRQENSRDTLFNWFPGFINRGYTLDGIVDILPDGKSRFVHGHEAARYRPRSRNVMQIYKKRGVPML